MRTCSSWKQYYDCQAEPVLNQYVKTDLQPGTDRGNLDTGGSAGVTGLDNDKTKR